MLSVRRFAASITQNAAQTCYDLTSNFTSSPIYKPLPQHRQPEKNNKETTHRIYKRAAYILFLFFTVFVLFQYWDANIFVTEQLDPRQRLSKENFTEAILRNPIVGVFDPEPVRAKCDEIKYQEGLIWHCGVIVGGIGNVMNMFLNCARYAIEAGATTLILPRLGERSNNLIDLGGEKESLDPSTSFDIEHFMSNWKQVCPRIRAVSPESDAEIVNSTSKALELEPQYVKKFNFTGKYMISDATGWREAFDSWLSNHAPNNLSAETPVRVHQRQTLSSWNPDKHSPEFVRSFPRLFQHPLVTRRLAVSALWNMEHKMNRTVVADSLVLAPNVSTVNNLTTGRIVRNGFMGAHLRVAADAVFAKFPGYESQAPFYLNEAQRQNLSTIYLATGSPEHRERFRKDAKDIGMEVYTKEDLLEGDELAYLKSLSWDQQALVDYDVLLHSSRFSGAVRSSFSWLLVSDRATLPEAQYPWNFGENVEIKHYHDGLSAISGNWSSNRPPVGTWPM